MTFEKRTITLENYDRIYDKTMKRLLENPSKIAALVRSYCCPSLTRQDRAELVKQARNSEEDLYTIVGEYMESKYQLSQH